MSATEIFSRSVVSPASEHLKSKALPHGFINLADVSQAAWTRLAGRAVEPNVFYNSAWALPVARHVEARRDPMALVAWDGAQHERLTALLPVMPASRVYKLPIPVLVAWEGYAPLTTPLVDAENATAAAGGLIDAAAASGAHALLLPHCVRDGAAVRALCQAAESRGLTPHILEEHQRAMLRAVGDADAMLRESLGAKRHKELRRQHNRLSDTGDVVFRLAATPQAVETALEKFLTLEKNGWKGARGTALASSAGDATFVRDAVPALAARQQCQIATLTRNGELLASGIVLRAGHRAFYFKVAYDEAESKNSPGVQLTLAITRHLCADPTITEVDSTADADHPMIDHIWRDRLAVCDLYIPTKRSSLLASPSRLLLQSRRALRERLKPLVHTVRDLKEKLR